MVFYMFQLLFEELLLFSDSFSWAVEKLYTVATEGSASDQRKVFLKFLDDFGTHYVKDAVFGAKVSYTQKYSEETTKRVGKETLAECATK